MESANVSDENNINLVQMPSLYTPTCVSQSTLNGACTGATQNLPESVPPEPTIPGPATNQGLQIVTRKRSSLNAGFMSSSITPPDNTVSERTQPPKKKKKYTPKPKNPTAEKPKIASSGNSKSKSKKGSTITKTKKGKPAAEMPAPSEPAQNGFEQNLSPPSVPPLKLQLPKLTKIPVVIPIPAPDPLPTNMCIKVEPQDFDNDDQSEAAENVLQDPETPGTSSGKPSRKKKSKGRNGNIYIGVFNRIEWMKLQNEFGFQSVNNFGTFVLQTMRKIHGDIDFWCDLAKASGVYSELDKYVWKNGFPHAVNLEGQNFIPPDVELTDDQRDEVIEMAKDMWEQRLQQLQLQQESGLNEGGSGAAVITIPEEGEEDEEEEGEGAGLEKYLENMANGQLPQSRDVQDEPLSADQVNMIWDQQMSNVQNMESFGKLFSYINSIDEVDQQVQDEDQDPNITENDNDLKEEANAGGLVEDVGGMENDSIVKAQDMWEAVNVSELIENVSDLKENN